MRLNHVPSSLPELIDPESTALVIWDMQNGLAGKASNTESLQLAAHKLIDAADKAGILVIWSQHILPPLDLMVGPWLLFLMRKQKVNSVAELRPFMQRGTEEAEFLPGFQPAPHHIVLEKSMPSLFVDTPLDLRLKARGIRTLVLTGVATDVGVEFTSRHATAKGYFSVIAEDATGSYTAANQARSIAFLESWATVASCDEITEIWSR